MIESLSTVMLFLLLIIIVLGNLCKPFRVVIIILENLFEYTIMTIGLISMILFIIRIFELMIAK